MRTRLGAALALVVVIGLGCQDQPFDPALETSDELTVVIANGRGGPPMSAEVTFGRNDLGSGFFPPGSHDASFKAVDAIRPRTVVISAGGTVDFVVSAAHKIAIYEPGIGPDDIDASMLEPPGTPFPFPPIINDPDGRIARGPLDFGPPVVWSWTFDEPGRYLVICEVLPHFADAKMYAWVDVK